MRSFDYIEHNQVELELTPAELDSLRELLLPGALENRISEIKSSIAADHDFAAPFRASKLLSDLGPELDTMMDALAKVEQNGGISINAFSDVRAVSDFMVAWNKAYEIASADPLEPDAGLFFHNLVGGVRMFGEALPLAWDIFKEFNPSASRLDELGDRLSSAATALVEPPEGLLEVMAGFNAFNRKMADLYSSGNLFDLNEMEIAVDNLEETIAPNAGARLKLEQANFGQSLREPFEKMYSAVDKAVEFFGLPDETLDSLPVFTSIQASELGRQLAISTKDLLVALSAAYTSDDVDDLVGIVSGLASYFSNSLNYHETTYIELTIAQGNDVIDAIADFSRTVPALANYVDAELMSTNQVQEFFGNRPASYLSRSKNWPV